MTISMKYLSESIDKDFDVHGDGLDEDNTTASLDSIESPNAFCKKTEEPNDGGVYKVKPDASDRFFKKISEQIQLIDRVLNEVSYKDFKNDDSRNNPQKINLNIKEINAKLHEVERLIDHASKLKIESGSDQGIFWKGTLGRFEKINGRLSRLTTKIREMNS